jgi:dihydrofolate reductase
MPKLLAFESISLDGYFSGKNGDLGWTHSESARDPEWLEFVAGNASVGNGVLLFGRKTYDMMASYWPTPQAAKDLPEVAKGMNQLSKVVFSRSLDKVSWQNTRLVKGDPVEEIRRLKLGTGPDMVILGSGSIVSQLTEAGLIDDYQLVVWPVILGEGRSLFEGVKQWQRPRLAGTRSFRNGNVVLSYARA